MNSVSIWSYAETHTPQHPLGLPLDANNYSITINMTVCLNVNWIDQFFQFYSQKKRKEKCLQSCLVLENRKEKEKRKEENNFPWKMLEIIG